VLSSSRQLFQPQEVGCNFIDILVENVFPSRFFFVRTASINSSTFVPGTTEYSYHWYDSSTGTRTS
jgi:hypothetical protein